MPGGIYRQRQFRPPRAPFIFSAPYDPGRLRGEVAGAATLAGDLQRLPLSLSGTLAGVAGHGGHLRFVEPPEVIPTSLADELFAGLWPIHEERWAHG